MGTFKFVEATIDDAHRAILAGEITVRDLVQGYLDRINAFDKNGPELNSIVTVNEQALDDADALDKYFSENKRLRGPLHGVPVLVKDQAETAGLTTTFGSEAVGEYVPDEDATVITNLKEQGAIILGKTTMPDFATSWFAYSSRSGNTKNPYDLDRDPGGSSSGTGAAIAANLGLVGIGEDTGGSIRLPASFDSLVGVRVTPGLISRHGMSPLVGFQDTSGPMARTVRDAAILLDGMVGYDPKDEYTSAYLVARHPSSYTEDLEDASVAGMTVGVVRQAFGDASNADSAPVNQVIESALKKIESAGAVLVDVEIPGLAEYLVSTSLYVTCGRFDINQFLGERDLPFKSVEAIIEAENYHPFLELLEAIAAGPASPLEDPEFYPKMAEREKFQRTIVNAMAAAGADVLVFPTIQVVPPTRAELDAGKWTTLTFPTNTLIASQSWLPAVSLPAGTTETGLPVGLEIMGLPFDEGGVLSAAQAFESVVKGRATPSTTPEL